MDLEQRLMDEIKSGNVDIERALLIISGLKTEEELTGYVQKISIIADRFILWRNSSDASTKVDDVQLAQDLFNYLWQLKSNRYNQDFLLTRVVDNQLSPETDHPVGDCIGLTSLYTVLGLRFGLKLEILTTKSHVISLLNNKILIENTLANGFGYSRESFFEYHGKVVKHDVSGLIPLVDLKKVGKEENPDEVLSCLNRAMAFSISPLEEAHLYIMRALILGKKGDLDGAIRDYLKAIELDYTTIDISKKGIALTYFLKSFESRNNKEAIANLDQAIIYSPDLIDAILNRGQLKMMIGMYHSAMDDAKAAEKINPESSKAACLKGTANLFLGNYIDAIMDFDKAITLDRLYAFSYLNRGNAKAELGDYKGALDDFITTISLASDPLVPSIALQRKNEVLRMLAGIH